MRLTKYAHSCVRLDDDDHTVVIDPGVFSEAAPALEGANAVLVTHEHADHFDVEALTRACKEHPALQVWCPESVRGRLLSLADRVTAVAPGDSFTAGGFEVRTFGGQHALIHAEVPIVANLGFLVAGSIYHPGDSFVVPDVPVECLLLPVHAPWSKVGEVLDFAVSVRPQHMHQIHDGLLNERGLDVVEGHVRRFAQRYGSRYEHLDTGQSVDL